MTDNLLQQLKEKGYILKNNNQPNLWFFSCKNNENILCIKLSKMGTKDFKIVFGKGLTDTITDQVKKLFE